MMSPKQYRTGRRGAAALEAAVVYPVAMLLLVGTLVLGIGVFRYEQLQALAREGARYASVHGPTYASDQNSSYATNATVLTYIETMTAGMQQNSLGCTVTWAPNPPTKSSPSAVTVQLTYSWVPEAFFQAQAGTMTASSTMPVTY
jgi:Flp pilus assembly protein TadG